MHYDELKGIITDLNLAVKKFDGLFSINEAPFNLQFTNKLVVDCDNFIAKVSSPLEAYTRIGVQQYFKSLGLNVFLPETIDKSLTNGFLVVTIQEKVKTKVFTSSFSDREALEELKKSFSKEKQEELQELFKKHTIIWYGAGMKASPNMGYDKDDKLKIFDFTGNFSMTENEGKVQLIGGNGGALWDVQF